MSKTTDRYGKPTHTLRSSTEPIGDSPVVVRIRGKIERQWKDETVKLKQPGFRRIADALMTSARHWFWDSKQGKEAFSD